MNSLWRCPKCGERVEPEFDVCWNCGTRRDGTSAADFQAEANDSSASDPEQVPVEPGEINPNERIVELCSAANVVEAQVLCSALEEEGIFARVVGDVLGNAAWGLPPGETIAPRVWVRQSDLPRIREVIRRRIKDRESEQVDWSEIDFPPDEEETAEPEEDLLPSDRRFRFLSQGFYIIGLICVLNGALWAWRNGSILSEYSATTDGRWIGDRLVDIKPFSTPGMEDIPFSVPKPQGFVLVKHPQYVYVVDGQTHYVEVRDPGGSPDRIVVHYKPDQPHEYIIGPITPPWIIITFALGIGAFSVFVGFKFR